MVMLAQQVAISTPDFGPSSGRIGQDPSAPTIPSRFSGLPKAYFASKAHTIDAETLRIAGHAQPVIVQHGPWSRLLHKGAIAQVEWSSLRSEPPAVPGRSSDHHAVARYILEVAIPTTPSHPGTASHGRRAAHRVAACRVDASIAGLECGGRGSVQTPAVPRGHPQCFPWTNWAVSQRGPMHGTSAFSPTRKSPRVVRIRGRSHQPLSRFATGARWKSLVFEVREGLSPC